ncbi:MAG: type IV pilin protein [Myxococcota bacterium]
MTRRRGFTLLEVMIVVAIIGILASMAIPTYTEMQLRAKRSEIPANLSGIRTAEFAYFATYDTYLTTNPNPSGALDRTPRDWDTSDATWNTLGWRPDAPVRATYEVDAAAGTDFTATGTADMDLDGTEIVYTATRDATPAFPSGDEHVF